MRRNESSSRVSPGRSVGGRNARHMNAVRPGTEMSPYARGLSQRPARDARSSSPRGVDVRHRDGEQLGGLGTPAARRRANHGALDRRRESAVLSGERTTAGSCTSPGVPSQSPATPIPPSHGLIDQVALPSRQQQGTRRGADALVSHSPHRSLSDLIP
jgi:hypothetical protein